MKTTQGRWQKRIVFREQERLSVTIAILAAWSVAFTEKLFPFYRPESIPVVKAYLVVYINFFCCEKGNPWKSNVPMMNEDPYREDVWLARVIDKSADITIMLGINAKQFVSILLTI